MALIYDANTTPVTSSMAMFQVKTLLKTAGWTVPLSSDGFTFNSSGDQITSGWGGANGMNNHNAWFVLKQPTAVDGYQRQLLFYRDNGVGQNWWIQYSVAAGFTGGGTTTPPTATDARNLLGTNTGGNQLFTNDGSYRWQIMADNATAYSFCAFAYPIGGGLANSIIMCDRMLAGSFPTQDNDPYVWFMSGYGTNRAVAFNNNGISSDCPMIRSDYGASQGAPSSWYKYGRPDAAFMVSPSMILAQFNGGGLYSSAPFGLGSNPHSGNDDLFPLLWGRLAVAGNLVGYKGTSSLMQWCGAQRATGDTITVSTPSDHIVVNGALVLPWNGSNPII